MEDQKLTLKELAPYLPYELCIYAKDCYPLVEFKMHAVGGTGFIGINEVINSKMYKPILSPMYDYDKFESDFDLSTDFYSSHIDSSNELSLLNSGSTTYLSDILTVTQWLFENHFDVFGLIEKGLAIDINTL